MTTILLIFTTGSFIVGALVGFLSSIKFNDKAVEILDDAEKNRKEALANLRNSLDHCEELKAKATEIAIQTGKVNKCFEIFSNACSSLLDQRCWSCSLNTTKAATELKDALKEIKFGDPP